MSLRDDLVNQQKEQSQKNREKAKEEKALSLQREQNYKQQKAQLQKQKEDAFDAFAQQVKEGHVPDEWVKLYDGYVEKIKEHILKGNLSFHFKDAVTADYYQEKASVNKGKNSVVTLMNDYLTKRLKQDGFSSAKFRLVDEITYYATDQDYADQQARQEINDAKAQADYENSWNNWYNYDTGGRAQLLLCGERKSVPQKQRQRGGYRHRCENSRHFRRRFRSAFRYFRICLSLHFPAGKNFARHRVRIRQSHCFLFHIFDCGGNFRRLCGVYRKLFPPHEGRRQQKKACSFRRGGVAVFGVRYRRRNGLCNAVSLQQIDR